MFLHFILHCFTTFEHISLVPTICHVIFHLIRLFNTNKDVKKNDFESLISKISQDNFYDEVYFSKVSNPQYIDYNSTIKRLHLKCFSAFYKLSILLYIACNIIKKAKLMLDLCVKHSTSLVEASFKESCRTWAYTYNLIENGFGHRGFRNFGKFSTSYLWQTFSNIGWRKYIEWTFNSKGNLYCLKNNIYIPVSIPMPMPTCWCRRIAVVFKK